MTTNAGQIEIQKCQQIPNQAQRTESEQFMTITH